MFASRYFAPRYFAPRYWPPGLGEAIEPPIAEGGGGAAFTREQRDDLTKVAPRPRKDEQPADFIERLEAAEKVIAVKTLREVIRKAPRDRLDILAIEQAIERAKAEAPPGKRKFTLDVDISDIIFPVAEPVTDDLRLRLLLLAGW